jgi:hypothetical protein
MLTKKDIQILENTFLTKKDAKQFLTKEDAKQFVTKEDAKQFATRDDVANFKDEIMFQILAMRDELSVVIGSRNLIEENSIRITKLESKIS